MAFTKDGHSEHATKSIHTDLILSFVIRCSCQSSFWKGGDVLFLLLRQQLYTQPRTVTSGSFSTLGGRDSHHGRIKTDKLIAAIFFCVIEGCFCTFDTVPESFTICR